MAAPVTTSCGASAAKDVIDGGTGFDHVSLNYSSSTQDITYDANAASLADGTVVPNVESFDLTTNAGNDTVTVSAPQKDFL